MNILINEYELSRATGAGLYRLERMVARGQILPVSHDATGLRYYYPSTVQRLAELLSELPGSKNVSEVQV